MIVYGDESYKIIGACFEVYNHIGCGFEELVYQECLEIEFRLRDLPCVPQVSLPITYKGQLLEKHSNPTSVALRRLFWRSKPLRPWTKRIGLRSIII